jgi:micrococcal nuclease
MVKRYGYQAFSRWAPGGEAASEPAAAAARDALSKTLRDRTVTIAPAETARDRYGRTIAQVFADGTWVQAALLQAGEVRAAPDRASAPCARALSLLQKPKDASAASVSGGPDFACRIRTASGTVWGASRLWRALWSRFSHARPRLHQFGADYRTDFTVTIEPEDVRTFRQAKFDIAALAGKRVRVRGGVEFYNGPEITITTPAAIEVLE